TWAASGEIDIMEAVNLKAQSDAPGAQAGDGENRIYGSLHYGKVWPDNVYSGQGASLPNNINPADDFHTYAIEWEEGEIRWYVDNI
ncbi:family 16 glycosylhydrolase, partial [Vibrio vulnificus]|uniref:family 16 glycosylhydrolase n=1 Tax=Vibrio vulnificus TaxID=672 RepID=UPI0024DF639B